MRMHYEAPKKVTYKDMPYTDEQRLRWWFRHYNFTMAIVLSMALIPIFGLYRGITWFPRLYIGFYLTLYYILYLTRKKVKEVHGTPAKKKKKWWHYLLIMLFTLLKLWILYIIIIVFLGG